MNEKLNPIRITDHEKGKTYELDFSRESVIFAERRQFKPEDLMEYPATRIPELFFYAFRKNHKNVSRAETDKLLEQMGGLSNPMLERLIGLYGQAGYSHLIQSDEGETKNGSVTVEL